ncbi:MAG: response regulator, partial [Desulfobacteraceae bacterium]|nr:response regulator [Desulfobacteraceae bacterium]
FQVCRQLKSDPITKAIPIIFITAIDKPGHKAKCLKYGAVDYITKPLVIREVKKRIKTHLTSG